jgi:exodeoxyribonuclease III
VKLATWNINSLNVRLPRVLDWLAQQQPDVLCLQELKLEDHRYPRAELEAAGYQSHVFGQKTYNGVAILAREGVQVGDVATGMKGFDDEQKRVIAATVDGIRDRVRVRARTASPSARTSSSTSCAGARPRRATCATRSATFKDLAFVGDLNIAPEPRDVHDPPRGKARSVLEPESARRSRAGSASASTTRSAGSTSRRRRSAGGTTGCSRSRRTWDCASTTSSRRRRSPRAACRARSTATRARARSLRPRAGGRPVRARVIGLDTTALPSRAPACAVFGAVAGIASTSSSSTRACSIRRTGSG